MTELEEILRTYHTIAVVGLSPKPDRPSYQVARYLQQRGYYIIPVNPIIKEIWGEPSYPDLRSIPHKVEIVDIFRRPQEVEPIVDEAIAIGAEVIWMQDGVINEKAAEKALQAGLKVVMDQCMMREHHRLFSPEGEREVTR